MPVDKKTLVKLEAKYGGIVNNVRREVTSKINDKDVARVHRGGDRMSAKHHGYARFYEHYITALEKRLGRAPTSVVEVGILTGIGMATWCDVYPRSSIFGLDIDTGIFEKNHANLVKRGAFSKNEPTIMEFDQFADNRKMLGAIVPEGGFELVIDDGCHTTEANLACFASFRPHLSKKPFLYIVEDNKDATAAFKKRYKDLFVVKHGELTFISNTELPPVA